MVLGTLTCGLALLIVSSRHYCDGQKTGYELRNFLALTTLLSGMLVGNVGGSSLPLPLLTALLRPRHTFASRAEGRHQLVLTTVNLTSQGSRAWPTQPQFSSSSFSWRSGYAECAQQLDACWFYFICAAGLRTVTVVTGGHRQVEFHFEMNWNGWLLLLGVSLATARAAFWLHMHPAFVASCFKWSSPAHDSG
jgi:hypothetical protein